MPHLCLLALLLLNLVDAVDTPGVEDVLPGEGLDDEVEPPGTASPLHTQLGARANRVAQLGASGANSKQKSTEQSQLRAIRPYCCSSLSNSNIAISSIKCLVRLPSLKPPTLPLQSQTTHGHIKVFKQFSSFSWITKMVLQASS